MAEWFFYKNTPTTCCTLSQLKRSRSARSLNIIIIHCGFKTCTKDEKIQQRISIYGGQFILQENWNKNLQQNCTKAGLRFSFKLKYDAKTHTKSAEYLQKKEYSKNVTICNRVLAIIKMTHRKSEPLSMSLALLTQHVNKFLKNIQDREIRNLLLIKHFIVVRNNSYTHVVNALTIKTSWSWAAQNYMID